jgi:hypothetical protein
MWLWAHARQGTLEQALRHSRVTPWQTETTLTAALDMLLAWTTTMAAPVTTAVTAWLTPLLVHQESHTLLALRRLCRPGVLLEAQRTALTTVLVAILTPPAHTAFADRIVELLGGGALLDRIAVLLARLAPAVAPPAVPSRPTPQGRHPHGPRRQAPAPDHGPADAARVLRLIGLLEQTHRPAVDQTLPEVMRDWLLRYPHLGTRAPEVVGALLSVLRQCPTAHTAMQVILERVPLSLQRATERGRRLPGLGRRDRAPQPPVERFGIDRAGAARRDRPLGGGPAPVPDQLQRQEALDR